MEHKRGKRSGNRGSDFRPSRLIVEKETHNGSTSSMLIDAGPFYECFETVESIASHLIPRKSLTSQQGLRLFAQSTEVIDQPSRVRDKVSGAMVTITNPKVVWRSDRTLLRRNRPEQLEDLDFRRITSKTKRVIFEPEEPATVEIPIDDLNLGPIDNL